MTIALVSRSQCAGRFALKQSDTSTRSASSPSQIMIVDAGASSCINLPFADIACARERNNKTGGKKEQEELALTATGQRKQTGGSASPARHAQLALVETRGNA